MKIKTKLHLSIAILTLIGGMVLFTILGATSRVGHEISKSSHFHELSSQVSALSMLTQDYILHKNERDIVQWRSVYHSLEQLIREIKSDQSMDRSDIDPLFHMHEDSGILFTQLQAVHDAHGEDLTSMRDEVAALGGGLLHRLQRMAEEVEKLQYASELRVMSSQRRFSQISIILLSAMIFGVIGIALFFYRTIGKSLHDLYNGTRLIASGNLDYAIEVRSRDEIGLLAQAFNEMRENLADSYSELKREIRDRRNIEDALREQGRQFKRLVETMNEGLATINAEGLITYVNDKLCEMCRYSREELIGKPFARIFEANSKGTVNKEAARQTTEGPLLSSYTVELLSSQRRTIPAIISGSPIFDDHGNYAGSISTITDITILKQAEKALKESEKRLRMLSAQLLAAQEEERKRIAQELHDSLGSLLSAIKFSLEKILSQPLSSDLIAESIGRCVSLTQNAIDESRRIMTELRPSILDDLGLMATLNWFCRQFQTVYSKIHVEQEFDIEEAEIAQPLKIVIFRIVQEALHNVSKHSKAEWVSVSLVASKDTIDLSIEDNGIGFQPESIQFSCNRGGGMGISGMRERAELSGGSFSMESVVGEGTSIRVSWPRKTGKAV